MRSIAGYIAIVLVLTFGWDMTALSAQGGGMVEHQMPAMADLAPGGCLTCDDEHGAMSASACFFVCIGAFVESTPPVAFAPRLGEFEVAAVAILEDRLRSPEPHPPRSSRV